MPPPRAADHAQNALAPKRVAPPPRPRSAWQSMVNASAKTLAKTIGQNPALPEWSAPLPIFDEKMAQAIRANDTPLFDAIFQRVCSHVVTHPNTPFHAPLALTEAVDQSDFYALHYLIHLGASPDSVIASLDSVWADLNQHRLLHRAVSKRLPDMAVALLAHGASIDPHSSTATLKGDTPLMLAAELAFPEMARLLLGAGALPNRVNHEGQSALDKALPYTLDLSFGESVVSRLAAGRDIALSLLSAGARADLAPAPARLHHDAPTRLPPLAAAIRIEDPILITALIDAGADASWLLPTPQPSVDSPPVAHPMSIWLSLLRGSSRSFEPIIQLAQSLAEQRAQKTLAQPRIDTAAIDAEPRAITLASDAAQSAHEPVFVDIAPPALSLPRARQILASRRALEPQKTAPAPRPNPSSPA